MASHVLGPRDSPVHPPSLLARVSKDTVKSTEWECEDDEDSHRGLKPGIIDPASPRCSIPLCSRSMCAAGEGVCAAGEVLCAAGEKSCARQRMACVRQGRACVRQGRCGVGDTLGNPGVAVGLWVA